MSIEALATASGETIETVLLCEREGLLGQAWWDRRGRRYDSRALPVLRLIRLGQRLGVELEEIRAVVPVLEDSKRIRAIVRGWAEVRLLQLAREQRELRRVQGLLGGFLGRSAADEVPHRTRVARELARLGRDLASPLEQEGGPRRASGSVGAASGHQRRPRPGRPPCPGGNHPAPPAL
jgi:DNA-binding transcriptional MerR regulator